MKTIYNALMAQLKEQVPELRWIDLDAGQIDRQTERLPVAFPCAVIGIALTNCEDLYAGVQLCRCAVIVRIAQNPPVSRTNSEVPDDVRETAMERYDLIEKVYNALQGFGTEEFNPLSRGRQQKENRSDGLFVYRMEFGTEFQEVVGD